MQLDSRDYVDFSRRKIDLKLLSLHIQVEWNLCEIKIMKSERLTLGFPSIKVENLDFVRKSIFPKFRIERGRMKAECELKCNK